MCSRTIRARNGLVLVYGCRLVDKYVSEVCGVGMNCDRIKRCGRNNRGANGQGHTMGGARVCDKGALKFLKKGVFSN